jgi:hypothetical protein
MGFTVVDTKYINGDDAKYKNKTREPGAKFLENETVTKKGQKLITGVETEGDGVIKPIPETRKAEMAKDAAISRLGKSRYNARQAVSENKQIKDLTSDKVENGVYGNYKSKNDTQAEYDEIRNIEKVKEKRHEQAGYPKQNTDSIMPSPLKGNAAQIESNKKWNQSVEQDAKDKAIREMPTNRAQHLKDAQEAAAHAKELAKAKIAEDVKSANYLNIKDKK